MLRQFAVRYLQAYVFHTTLALDQLRVELERVGPWHWEAPRGRGPGATLSSRSGVEAGQLTITTSHSTWHELLLELEVPDDQAAKCFADIEHVILREMLPAIAVSEIKRWATRYDRHGGAAFRFRCRETLDEIRRRLDELGPWKWIPRDNDSWGEYTSAGVLSEPDEGIAKIIPHGGLRYELQYSLSSCQRDADARFAAVTTTFLEELLPALGATDVEPCEASER